MKTITIILFYLIYLLKIYRRILILTVTRLTHLIILQIQTVLRTMTLILQRLIHRVRRILLILPRQEAVENERGKPRLLG